MSGLGTRRTVERNCRTVCSEWRSGLFSNASNRDFHAHLSDRIIMHMLTVNFMSSTMNQLVTENLRAFLLVIIRTDGSI